ncbi:uncharacterized protein EAF01_007996 [Botrytis porri]|uniref:uncharacterized protein n=1 Tax=Botrytis porri TaxID=87229 RepID=UPI00190229B1|nr:uncharacterized protein EAF01_007996 [Botrytis porri]KAF7900694.1 hypothetical protein EAF01_007996 [Botrytis porri]
MFCFGMASGSPPLHSRSSVPPRVIAILPPTYRSNCGIGSMLVIVEPYIPRPRRMVYTHHINLRVIPYIMAIQDTKGNEGFHFMRVEDA